jgi:hypothetical protein
MTREEIDELNSKLPYPIMDSELVTCINDTQRLQLKGIHNSPAADMYNEKGGKA